MTSWKEGVRLREALGLWPEHGEGASAATVLGSSRVRPQVLRFVEAHRQHGYRCATLDPLGLAPPLLAEALDPGRFGLASADALTTDGSPVRDMLRVQELDAWLESTYCGTLALDSSAVRDEERRAWLHTRFESAAAPAHADGQRLLHRLVRAQAWERHVARHFPKAKRFSLEGCEALVPLLDALMEGAAANGVGEIFMGMPHRGRVNVLVNVLGVPPAHVLDYFDPATPHPERHRDLIYHQGSRHAVETRRGPVVVTLAPNPSHLQSVYPVVAGMTRASRTQETAHPDDGRAMAIVLHGDAAFAGQGVVMETLALTRKPGYAIGGIVHVVIDNQVGFTEANRMDAGHAAYCTDVTRMIDAPVLRVNADAPADVLRAAAIAIDYRATFGSDIVIDLVGYRRLGHSEHDEPALTDPRTYAAIERHPPVVDVYAATLVAAGVAGEAETAALVAQAQAAADAAFPIRAEAALVASVPAVAPAPDRPAFTRERLQAAVAITTHLPAGFEPHPVIHALIERWLRYASDGNARADWCFTENMAHASILAEDIAIRVSGLDVRRGTFFHRHAAWHDQATGEALLPLRRLGRFDAVNSVLSEEAVLGFEYGHSVQDPHALTIWEAQFGDFVNGAQVYLDQYIAAGEEKWGRPSALTVLLPHGHEGVGPEHSNAWLGRFLDLCGGGNLRVAVPSTSAQMFHLLRRQAFDPVRKPLVVMTPKAVLYGNVASHSPVHALHEGGFEPMLDDDGLVSPAADVTRAVLCSGKLYYDLRRARQAGDFAHVALLRLEELHPFPAAALARTLRRYPALRELVWAQEENLNQGAWSFVRDALVAALPPGATLQCVARPATASGATSSHAVHDREQRELVAHALGAGTPAH